MQKYIVSQVSYSYNMQKNNPFHYNSFRQITFCFTIFQIYDEDEL